ncbi:hypothetical protein GLOIN_2v1766467 [Rhizophagus clarus]|uniref:Uncharacterized protein n=1 Tax=Rhizophagus clarus TaxID=94130 RepID=A0A8H3M6N9_9GLOM|nr:hypothetical protein GLOIN_2v1766467 [Rhizophagus clarus]
MLLDLKIWYNLTERITNLKEILCNENDKVKKLKRQASYQRKNREKKTKLLKEYQEVLQYDSPDHPPLLTQYPDLHKYIHDCIEFGVADKKRRNEVIKVRIICHLQKELKSKYNEYFSYITLSNYLLPFRSNSIAARTHHHPVNIAIASVSRDEKSEHPDKHYCLASIKGAKQFAALFLTYSVIISQDDKVKVPLGIPAQKLILLVYLLINPHDTNDTFYNGQLSIFVRPQYQVGTSLAIHMSNLNSLTQDSHFNEILNVDGQIKPIWIFLVDKTFDLDYLFIWTYIPSQSAYNSVEYSMSTLSQKLASIMLPIDKFDSYLKFQGQVVDLELAIRNFCYTGETLSTLWKRDSIFRKPVITQYTDQKKVPFDDVIFPESGKESNN